MHLQEPASMLALEPREGRKKKKPHFTSTKLPYVNAVNESECASPNSADAIKVQKD